MVMAEVFREEDKRTGKKYPRYRGMVRTGPGPKDRYKATLFTDLEVSKRELRRLQSEADSAAQDPVAFRRREHAVKPVGDHIADYLAYLGRTTKTNDHVRIAKFMLDRLVALTGWRKLSDISQESVEPVIANLVLLDGRAATVGYRNCFVKRAKAFTRWLSPDRLALNPLAKLRRCSSAGAVVRRGRRDGTDDEIAGLIGKCDPGRQLALCLTVLAGLRRAETKSLTWADVRLSATVPFLHLRGEFTKNGKDADLPLHPELVRMLEAAGPGMPAAHVVKSVPEVETIRKYLGLAGFEFERDGLRLDHHALRHTYVSNLGRTGCSRATLKALARHSNSDVTDGYLHASMDEMYTAVCRLRSPFAPVPVRAVATGTDSGGSRRAYAEQNGGVSGHFGASACTTAIRTLATIGSTDNSGFPAQNSGNLKISAGNATVSAPRPSTQVD
jgi:integrase